MDAFIYFSANFIPKNNQSSGLRWPNIIYMYEVIIMHHKFLGALHTTGTKKTAFLNIEQFIFNQAISFIYVLSKEIMNDGRQFFLDFMLPSHMLFIVTLDFTHRWIIFYRYEMIQRCAKSSVTYILNILDNNISINLKIALNCKIVDYNGCR